jgi:hypothetical protein
VYERAFQLLRGRPHALLTGNTVLHQLQILSKKIYKRSLDIQSFCTSVCRLPSADNLCTDTNLLLARRNSKPSQMSKGRWENGVNWRHPQRMKFKQTGSHGNTSRGGNSMGQPEFLLNFRIWWKPENVFSLRSALFCGITQRRVVILYRRFGTTYQSHLQG